MSSGRRNRVVPELSLPSWRYGNAVTHLLWTGLRTASESARDAAVASARTHNDSWLAYWDERTEIRARYKEPNNPVVCAWNLGKQALRMHNDQRDITIARPNVDTVQLSLVTNAEFSSSDLATWIRTEAGFYLSSLVFDGQPQVVDKTGPAKELAYVLDSLGTYGRFWVTVEPREAQVVPLFVARAEGGAGGAQAA